MNKKLILGIGLVTGMCLLSEVAFADELIEALELYLEDSSLDFLGHDFEKILFNATEENNSELISKLKFLLDDIKTMPLQLRAYYKIFTNKINILAYGSLAGISGSKVALGGEQFTRLVIKLIKLAIR